MLIKDIKDPAIKELAILRTKEYRGEEGLSDEEILNMSLGFAFSWESTPERSEYWHNANTPAPQEPVITLKEAFEFAEWTCTNHYDFRPEYGTWINLTTPGAAYKTTEQLYQLFKRQNNDQ